MMSSDMSPSQYYMQQWPYMLFYQYTGMRVDQWQHLRTVVAPYARCMICKNSHIAAYISHAHMCHGATCIIGVQSMKDIHRVHTATQHYGHSMLLIGGYWGHQCRSYQDVMHLCTLPSLETLRVHLLEYVSPVPQLHGTLQYAPRTCVDTLHRVHTQLYTILWYRSTQHS